MRAPALVGCVRALDAHSSPADAGRVAKAGVGWGPPLRGPSREAICQRGRATEGFCPGSRRRRGGHGVGGGWVRWRSVEPECDSPRPDSRGEASAPGWGGTLNVELTVLGPPRRRQRPYRAHCCARRRTDGATDKRPADWTSRRPRCGPQAWTHPTASPVLIDVAGTQAPAVDAVVRSVCQGAARGSGAARTSLAATSRRCNGTSRRSSCSCASEGGEDRQTGGLSLTAYDAGKVPPTALTRCTGMYSS